MSGFSYIIIKSDAIEPKDIVDALNIGHFQKKRIANGEESLVGGPSKDEIWLGRYNGRTIICNLDLSLFGISYRKILPFEQKLIDVHPNCEIGAYIFNDTAMAGGYYIIKNNEKKVFRNWDSWFVEEGVLEPFEVEANEKYGQLSIEHKAEIYTCEAVNAILGIKPYHSEEFISDLNFEVFVTTDDFFKECLNNLHNVVFKPKEIKNESQNSLEEDEYDEDEQDNDEDAHIQHKIDYLISLGFDYNLNHGGEWLISYLEQYHVIDNENYPLWLIIREMGNTTIVDKDLKHFSKNISTIGYEDFFFYHRISDILLELNRISNGAITFKVIDEFEPVFNYDNTINNHDFKDVINMPNGITMYNCKYEICGQLFDFDYHFTTFESTVLNPDFLDELLSKLDHIFLENNINYFSEEFITFFQLPQHSQEALIETVFLNKDLIKKYRKTEFQKKQEKILNDKIRSERERHDSFLQGLVDTRFATKEEIERLIDYKKQKLIDITITTIMSTAFIGLIIWGLNTELLNILPIQVVLWFFFVLTVCFVLFVIYDSNIWLINKDLKERQIERLRGIVSKVYKIEGKNYISLKKSLGIKNLIFDGFLYVHKGDEIILHVFQQSRVYIELGGVNRPKSNKAQNPSSNIVIVTDKCPACYAMLKETDFVCPECGLSFK